MEPTAATREHFARRRELLARAPELAKLSGANAWSLACIAGLMLLQGTLAFLVRDGGLLRVFVCAFGLGQFVLHAGGALVHDAAHGLILRGPRGRLLVDVALDALLTSFGHHAQYQLDHVHSHHRYLGDYARDYEHKDACRFWARAALRREHPAMHVGLLALQLTLDLLPLGFMISDDLVAFLERRLTTRATEDRTRAVPRPTVPRARRLACIAASSCTLLVVGVLLGGWSLLYAVWSLSIFQGRFGISNVGQVLSEHPDGDPARPTRSYYGPWNRLLFNTGYHDEHHTFPSVAWNRLPRLRAAAPDIFDRVSEHGYLGWWWRYVFAGVPRRGSAALDSRRP